ncbi:MAG: NAD(+) diphosphatase [Treponema sp.]|nr:NAD(+) diphosphatase [Treponema sp.]
MSFTRIELNKVSLEEIEEKIQSLSYFFVFSGRELLAYKDQTFINKDDFLSILGETKKSEENKNDKIERDCPQKKQLKKINDSLVISCFLEGEYSYASLFLKEILENYLNKYEKEYSLFPLTKFFAEEDQKNVFLLSRARSLSAWLSEYKFCPGCGGLLLEDKVFSALFCPDCKKQLFPRLEPCVIVLVRKKDKILLARHKGRLTDRFVCISGFIEAGESAEEAVFREVKEETGISVKNIRFMGSQSWPFPDQLMLAFEADWESGEIKIQEDELLEAAWFSKDQPPSKLSPGSVAYKLINGLF